MTNISNHNGGFADYNESYRMQQPKKTEEGKAKPTPPKGEGVKKLVDLFEKRLSQEMTPKSPVKATKEIHSTKTTDPARKTEVISRRALPPTPKKDDLQRTLPMTSLDPVAAQKRKPLPPVPKHKEPFAKPEEKKLVPDNKKFEAFDANLKILINDSSKKLMLQGGQIEVRDRSRFGLGQSGRSKETQAALEEITTQINKALNAGYTHFKKDGEDYSLKALADDFVKTPYARNIIKQSPSIASSIASLQLREISREELKSKSGGKAVATLTSDFIQLLNNQPYAAERVLDVIDFLTITAQQKPNINSLRFQELYQEFKSLLNDKPVSLYDIEEFKTTLPTSLTNIQAIEGLKQGPKIEIGSAVNSLNMSKKSTQIMKEILDTEKSFRDSFQKLVLAPVGEKNYFQTLQDNGILTEEEAKAYIDLYQAIISHSTKLIERLEAKATAKDQFQAYLEFFSPHSNQEAHTYLNDLWKSTYKNIKFNEILKRNADNPVFTSLREKFFEKTGHFPQAFIVMGTQRAPRHELLQKELSKETLPEEITQILKDNIAFCKAMMK